MPFTVKSHPFSTVCIITIYVRTIYILLVFYLQLSKLNTKKIVTASLNMDQGKADAEDIAALLEELQIEVVNGSLNMNSVIDSCFVEKYAAVFYIAIVKCIQPILIVTAMATNIALIIPVYRLSRRYFPPYAYLIFMSLIHLINSCLHMAYWLQDLHHTRYIENWKKSSPFACQVFNYASDAAEQFQSWLLVCLVFSAYRMKVSKAFCFLQF